jgi:GntR family phosphonate transport system transcriptional regulator
MHELERGAGVALWRQIQRILEADIAGGGCPAGEKLPTEAELAERFGVNRHTVRRALGVLEAKGLVRIEQGRGIFVREPMLDYSLARRVRFSENLLRQRRSPGGRLLEAAVVAAPKEAAERLGLMPGSPVVRLEVAGSADGAPLNVATSFFPAARFPDFIPAYRETGSISAALARFGVADYVRKWTRITARMPSARDADLLRQPRSRPVLVAESVNLDPAGEPVEYGLTRWASDRVQMVVEP